MLPLFYQTHLQHHLTRAQFLVLGILIELLQSQRQVKLERLASVFPYPITTESRRRKLQRFLSLPQLTLSQIWYPIITYWLTTYFSVGQTLSIVIDRTFRGLYQHTNNRFGMGEQSYPFILVAVTKTR